jgi:hypothetical protein
MEDQDYRERTEYEPEPLIRVVGNTSHLTGSAGLLEDEDEVEPLWKSHRDEDEIEPFWRSKH